MKKVTTKKYGGDDLYSWAVFVNGRVVNGLTGLNRAQAKHYKRMLEEDEEKR